MRMSSHKAAVPKPAPAGISIIQQLADTVHMLHSIACAEGGNKKKVRSRNQQQYWVKMTAATVVMAAAVDASSLLAMIA